jgi:ABC-2 type transport system permease protein
MWSSWPGVLIGNGSQGRDAFLFLGRGGRFRFETVDPGGEDKEELRRSLYRKYGFRPMPVSLLSEDSFYLHILLRVGDKHEAIHPAPDMTEADLKSELTASLKRMTPGFLKTVGLMLPPPEHPPHNPMMMGHRQPESMRRFELLRERLSESYTIREVDLKEGRVPGDVDVLMLVGPQDLDEKQRFAVDQYLMRGGAVVICAGAFVMEAGGPGGLGVKPVTTGLEELLKGWGVSLQKSLVLDPQNEAFPVPVERNVMGMTVRELQLVSYPFFVDVRQDGMAEENLIVRGLPSVTLQFASPLEVKPPEGVKATVLMRSSKGSWVQTSTNVQPDFDRHGEKGFGVEGETRQRDLAVMLTGTFKSAFASKPSPLFKEEGEKAGDAKADKKGKRADPAGRTIKSSPPGARLLVVGSSEFVNDLVLSLSRQTGSERYTNNLQLVQNIADWSVADLDLLSIRSRGSYARTLKPLEPAARTRWVEINFGVVVVGLGLIILVSRMRRRAVRPLQLSPARPTEQESES